VGRTWLKKLGLACAGTAIAFGLCEVAARMWYPAPPDPAREPQIQYQADSDIGYVHVPNQQGWIDDGWVTINSLGLRGPEPAVPKPKGVFRIMVLGDSYTVGWGVNDDETFCALLEGRLREANPGREFEVVNCGVAGYDTKHEERQLRRLAPVLRPDLILVAFHHNDLPYGTMAPDGVPDSSQSTGQAVSPIPGQVFRIGAQPTWWNRNMRQSRALYCIKDSLLRLKNTGGKMDLQAAWEMALLEGKQSPAVADVWRREAELLQRLKSLAESLHCPIGIMPTPCREQVRQDYPNEQYQKKVQEVGERLGFFVVDPLPAFVERRDRAGDLFISYDRYHASAAGHRLIAETLLDSLPASTALNPQPGNS
jgi:lysophospholipase L1-like esterase